MDNESTNLENAEKALETIKSNHIKYSLKKVIGMGIIYALLAVVDAINAIESDTIDINNILSRR